MQNKHTSQISEGTQRERLAAYFLNAPPFDTQTPAERSEYCRKLRELGQLEVREVLDAAGSARPLIWGNPVPYLQNLLTAAQRLAAGLGYPLLLFPAKEMIIHFHTMLHPRLLSLATVGLLRDACIAAPKEPVWVRLREQDSCLTVTVTAATPFGDPAAIAVAKECARLHSGSLAQCDNTIGFSFTRMSTPPPTLTPPQEALSTRNTQANSDTVWDTAWVSLSTRLLAFPPRQGIRCSVPATW